MKTVAGLFFCWIYRSASDRITANIVHDWTLFLWGWWQCQAGAGVFVWAGRRIVVMGGTIMESGFQFQMPFEGIDGRLLTTFSFERKDNCADIKIVGCMELTPAGAAMDGAIRGTINLRGQLVPVIDAQARMGGEPIIIDHGCCILLIEHVRRGRSTQVGLLVPDISDVLDVISDEIDSLVFNVDACSQWACDPTDDWQLVDVLGDVERFAGDAAFDYPS